MKAFPPDADLLQLMQDRLSRIQPRRLDEGRPSAGVLVALTDNPCDPELVLTLRATTLTSHGGEVAFPGGKRDPEDPSLLHTALREAEEEVGLVPSQVQRILPLGQVVSKQGLLVAPFVGVISAQAPLVPNPHEIDALFRVPLRFFLEDRRWRTDRLEYRDKHLYVPCYRYQGHLIWGLTAYVVVELLNLGLGATIPLRPRPEVMLNQRS